MTKNALKLNNVTVRHGGGTPTDSNAIRSASMSIYRKIYESHFGQIPKDEDGRTYDIHHIDGNRKNNDPSNLVALSIKEHYKVHYDQGDYGAALRIIARMEVPPELLSELGRKAALKQLEQGKSKLKDGEWARQRELDKVKNGTHPFVGDKNPVHKYIADGTWHFLGDKNPVFKMLKEGTHNTQKRVTCPHCNKQGQEPAMLRWHFDNCKQRGKNND